MRIQCDTLKYATILKEKGLKSIDADGLMSTITEMEIHNLHSKEETNKMIFDSVKVIIAEEQRKRVEQRREFDARLAEQRRASVVRSKEVAARLKEMSVYHEAQLREHRSELLSSRRWMIGTIITVGFSLAAYLSALIHFNH